MALEEERFSPKTGRILLSEGRADRRFFEKLIEVHGLPKFDMPWPIVEEEIRQLPKQSQDHQYHGDSRFKDMLRGVADFIILGHKVKGILIATDAGDVPDESFNNVCKQIRDAHKDFPIPGKPTEIARGNGNMPSIAVFLVPLSSKGSLETLCVEYLRARPDYEGVFESAAQYLSTPPTDIQSWANTEKQDKAYFQCMIAGTHKNDPTMAVQSALLKGFIDLTHSLFNPVRDEVYNFCNNL